MDQLIMPDGLTIDEDGNKWYYLDNKLHREDGPAVEYFHRKHPAENIEEQDEYDDYGYSITNHKEWFIHGVHHRLDYGPTIEWADGTKTWHVHGVLHRLDGPAIDRFDGQNFWFVNGKRVLCESQEEFEQLMRLRAFW
jgi:hypothetical protein